MVQLRAAFAAYAKFIVTTSQFCEPTQANHVSDPSPSLFSASLLPIHNASAHRNY
jgi:hypothetical protein